MSASAAGPEIHFEKTGEHRFEGHPETRHEYTFHHADQPDRPFVMEVTTHDHKPGHLHIDAVVPKHDDRGFSAVHRTFANTFGAGGMKAVFRKLKAAHPDTQTVSYDRLTGAHAKAGVTETITKPVAKAFFFQAALNKARQFDAEIMNEERRVGHQKGITPGGTFTDHEGQQWYLKTHDKPEHAMEEHLANVLYRHTGNHAPHSAILNVPGRGWTYGSKYLHNFETLQGVQGKKWQPGDSRWDDIESKQPGIANRFLRGAAVDTLLHMSDHHHQNVGVIKTGSGEHVPVRLDNGGGLFHTAWGAKRTDFRPAHQWHPIGNTSQDDAMFTTGRTDENIMNHRDILESGLHDVHHMLKRYGGWQSFVDRTVPMATPEHRGRLATLLQQRHRDLLAHAYRLREKAGVPNARIRGMATGPVIANNRMPGDEQKPSQARPEADFTAKPASTARGRLDLLRQRLATQRTTES